jgi:hypothetical protein
MLRWGLIPHWNKDPNPRTRPINATAERVATAPMFRHAYAKRRCLVPVNVFYEWTGTKVERAKQPYALGMKDGSPLCPCRDLGGLEAPAVGGVAADLLHHHLSGQRAGFDHSRAHAGDPPAGGL